MIKHHIDRDGGFTAGDTETGLTVYAYPSSLNAAAARRDPVATAAAMLLNELWRKHPDSVVPQYRGPNEYDRRNWETLNAASAATALVGC